MSNSKPSPFACVLVALCLVPAALLLVAFFVLLLAIYWPALLVLLYVHLRNEHTDETGYNEQRSELNQFPQGWANGRVPQS